MAQIIKADLDDILFEDRERRYGAYFLRKRYNQNLLIGAGSVLILFIVLSALPGLSFGGQKAETKRVISSEINLLDLPPPPEIEEEKPPPPPPKVKIPPPQLKTVAFKIPEPTPKDELEEEEEMVSIDSLKPNVVIGFENIEGEDEGVIEIPDEGDGEEPVIEAAEPDINAFIFDAEEPKPRNMDDIRKMIGYPEIAKDAGIEGQVVVRVLVDKLGNYKKHKVIKKVHPILAEACEKQVPKLKFTPAIQGGKPIPFWVNIPFKFKLLN
ncbi:energy transducer TonB [bacterium]|nr:energy transducer TonB [bacterium]